MYKNARKALSLLLAVTLLLSLAAVYLPVQAAVTDYGLQTYDGIATGQYNYSNTAGVYGNGEGRYISAAYDHTTGTGRSVQLTMNGYKTSAMTAQTTVKAADGSHPQLALGKAYRITAWVLSPVDITVLYRIATVKGKQDVTNGLQHKLLLEESIALTAGEWKELTYDITATAAANVTDPYLTLGASPLEGVTDTYYLYVDDVQVMELEAVNEQDYENFPSGTALTLKGTGTLSSEQNHTPGGEYSAKVLMNDQSGTGRAQLLLRDSFGQPVQAQQQMGYEVTMWVYVDSTNATEPLNYWLSSSATATALTSKPTGYAEYDMVANQKNVPSKTWTKLTIPVESVTHGSYLIFGVTTRKASSTNKCYIYIDDVAVVETDFSSTVSTFQGGLLYAGGKVGTLNGEKGSAVYTVDGTPYTALRVAADYTCVDGDPTKVRYGTDTWNVTGRGVLLYYSTGDEAVTPMVEDAATYKASNYITGDKLQSYWSLKDSTLRYSVLVKNINQDKAENLKLTFRAYMVITDGAVERTVYGDTVPGVTAQRLYEAAAAQGSTVKWFDAQ